jgi:DnaK suppressor protein
MGAALPQRDEIAVENAPDALDLVQRAAERDLALHQIESNFSRVQSLKLALQRIQDGSYGSCLECGDEISPKRLTAIPWASYCIQCQEVVDRQRIELQPEGIGIMLRMRDVA